MKLIPIPEKLALEMNVERGQKLTPGQSEALDSDIRSRFTKIYSKYKRRGCKIEPETDMVLVRADLSEEVNNFLSIIPSEEIYAKSIRAGEGLKEEEESAGDDVGDDVGDDIEVSDLINVLSGTIDDDIDVSGPENSSGTVGGSEGDEEGEDEDDEDEDEDDEDEDDEDEDEEEYDEDEDEEEYDEDDTE